MSSSTCLLFSSNTPFRMLISSSRRGSSPCLWNAKNDLPAAHSAPRAPLPKNSRTEQQESQSERDRRGDALELGLLVGVRVARAEDPVEQLGDRVGDGRCVCAALEGPTPRGRAKWGPGWMGEGV